MKIRQLVCMAGDRVTWDAGTERDCDEAEAIRLIDAGFAEPVGPEAVAAYKSRALGPKVVKDDKPKRGRPPKVKDDKPKRGRPPKVKDDKPDGALPNLADNDDESDDLKDS